MNEIKINNDAETIRQTQHAKSNGPLNIRGDGTLHPLRAYALFTVRYNFKANLESGSMINGVTISDSCTVNADLFFGGWNEPPFGIGGRDFIIWGYGIGIDIS